MLIAGLHPVIDQAQSPKRIYSPTSSRALVAMDRRTGKVLWQRKAAVSFRHYGICAGAGKVFCIDRLSTETLTQLARRGRTPEESPRILALDARTGKVIWQTDKHVGQMLSYSEQHDILVANGALRGADGSVLWTLDEETLEILWGGKWGLMINDDTIYPQIRRAFDLRTGKQRMWQHPAGYMQEWRYARSHGCGPMAGGTHILTFRSACAAFFDLKNDGGTANLGGFRSGCTSNLIVADGVVNAPDYTRTCGCAYQNHSSLALIHMPQMEYWSFGANPTTGNVAYNVGAPGDRRAADGALWRATPVGADPDRRNMQLVTTVPAAAKTFYRHSSRMDPADPWKWIGASGAEGLRTARVPLAGVRADKPVTVRLLFAEPEHTAAGKRVFSISLDGKTILKDLDIFTEAGAPMRTIVKEFSGLGPVMGGADDVAPALEFVFTPGIGQPLICGVQIVGVKPKLRPAPPREGIYTIGFDKALPGGKAMTVALDCTDEKISAALAEAPTFNKVAFEVDTSELALSRGSLGGKLSITIPSDGYNPPAGKTVRCVLALDAKITRTGLTGTFDARYGVDRSGAGGTAVKGEMSGTISPHPRHHGPVVWELEMVNAAGRNAVDKKVWGRRGLLRITTNGGKVVQAVMHGHGDGRQVNYFEAVVTDVKLTRDGSALAGTVSVKETKGDVYVYIFSGTVVGDRVGGTFTKKVNGSDAPGGPFRGTYAPIQRVSPANAVYNLELLGAVAGGKQLNTFIPRSGGEFGQGLGYSGQFNHAYHDVRGAGLRLKGRDLTGTLKVTINPDPYVPRDGKPIACTYSIDARIHDGCVSGTFKGRFGSQDVSGRIVGRLQTAPPVPEPAQYNLKLEEGVSEGAPWLRRVYVSFVTTRGKAAAGAMSNNKGGWKGTFTSATVEHHGSAFTATIAGTVDTTRGPRKGAYTFKLTGRAVGAELVGKVETWRDGKLTKKGTAFMGRVGPARVAPR